MIQGKDIASVKSDPSLSILESSGSGNNYRMIFDSTNPASPLSKYKELRQAMLYAMDRDAMAKTLGFGSGAGRRYLLPKSSFAYDTTEQTPNYWFDKAKAEQLVKDVIAKDPAIAVGGKIPITLSVIDRAVDKAQSEMIKQMGESVGFAITLETLERAAWTAKLVKRPGQPGGKFDMASMRNPVTADGQAGGRYTVTWTVSANDQPSAGLRTATVSVAWTDAEPHVLQLAGYVRCQNLPC